MNDGLIIEAQGIDRGAILPPLDFRHLIRLTDDTGILQHATYSVPNREHGYCVDDVARALVVACEADAIGLGEELHDLVPIYLSFIHHAFNRENGRFRNFMSYAREWLEDAGSEDAHGRTLWGLGVATASAPLASQRTLAARLFEDALSPVRRFSSPRAMAFAILGLDCFTTHRTQGLFGEEWLAILARRLHDAFTCNSDEGWPWCEDIVTYSNAILPMALLVAGERLNDDAMRATALDALDWLIRMQIAEEGHLAIVGNDGWLPRGGERARFDQQPIDAAAIALACEQAYDVTNDPLWLERISLGVGWFLGWNDHSVSLYDQYTGGCYDGLGLHGPNENQGAESTVEWLLARLAAERVYAGFDRRTTSVAETPMKNGQEKGG